ncbi:hypothetical protein [Mesorhizobium sp.]|uniref:hypothetical protein n=1 Tax=Mesorhizobium sp. TaxID=1871066 RepID=UPI0025F30A29|nr:hypothetical protein [Mesorhizobium sp.]
MAKADDDGKDIGGRQRTSSESGERIKLPQLVEYRTTSGTMSGTICVLLPNAKEGEC